MNSLQYFVWCPWQSLGSHLQFAFILLLQNLNMDYCFTSQKDQLSTVFQNLQQKIWAICIPIRGCTGIVTTTKGFWSPHNEIWKKKKNYIDNGHALTRLFCSFHEFFSWWGDLTLPLDNSVSNRLVYKN